MENELWKVVENYSSYEVSNLGKVRSSKYEKVRGFKQILKPSIQKDGYLTVSLSRKGKYITARLHRLVYEVFCGLPKEGNEVCHNNGIKTDCRLSNLREDTRSGNHLDKYVHGTAQIGEKSNGCKYTEHQIKKFKSLRSQGWTIANAAKDCGISYFAAERVSSGATWAWLKA